eukprot:2151475-Prymnesium_polylepis.1
MELASTDSTMSVTLTPLPDVVASCALYSSCASSSKSCNETARMAIRVTSAISRDPGSRGG